MSLSVLKKVGNSSSVSREILTSEDEVFWREQYYPNLPPTHIDKHKRQPTYQLAVADSSCFKALVKTRFFLCIGRQLCLSY